MIQHLTIMGDRQHGRSYAALLLAINDAVAGGQVLYECASMGAVHVAFGDAVEMAQNHPQFKMARRSNGNERIAFTSGGVVRFVNTGRSQNGTRLFNVQTHVLDDVVAEPHHCATRVIKAVLR